MARRDRALSILAEVFGYAAFRDGQKRAVDAVLRGDDARGATAHRRRQIAVLPGPGRRAFPPTSGYRGRRRDELPTLNEQSLNEAAGIGGDMSVMTPIGPIRNAAGNFIGHTLVPQGGAVDFSGDDRDGDGTADNDTGIARDINFLDGTTKSPGQTLRGHEDWKNLRFYFWESPAFADGVRSDQDPELDLDTDLLLATAGVGAGSLAFKHEMRKLNESSGDVTVTVVRSAGLEGTVTVDYAVTGGTATVGADYTAANGTLTFAENEYIKTFSISLVDDLLAETDETIVLALSNATGGAAAGDIPQTTLRILDDDGPGIIQFEHAFFNAREDAGEARITLSRTQGSSGDVTVQFATSGGTATPDVDYQPIVQVVSFADGEFEKTVTVPIIADREADPSEGIILELSQASNGATLGALSHSVLTIQDTEPIEFQFDQAAYQVNETDGQVTVTVQRLGNVDRQGSVDVRSAGFTAGGGKRLWTR